MNQMKKAPIEIGHYGRKKRSIQRKIRRHKRLLVISCIIFVVFIAIITVLFSKNTKQNELLGVWRYNQYTAYEFEKNGQGCLCVDDIKYRYEYAVSDKTLKLDFEEDIVQDCTYTFEIEGNQLTLIGGEGTDKGTYKLNKQ